MKTQIDNSTESDLVEEALAAIDQAGDDGRVYGEHFTAPPVPSDRILTGVNEFGGPADMQADKFLRRNRKKFAQFQAHEAQLLHVGSQYHNLVLGLEEEKGKWNALMEAIKDAQTVDYSANIFEALKLGVHILQAASAPALAANFILKQNGETLLILIETHLKELEAALEDFKKENDAILRELNLL